MANVIIRVLNETSKKEGCTSNKLKLLDVKKRLPAASFWFATTPFSAVTFAFEGLCRYLVYSSTVGCNVVVAPKE